MKGNRSKVQRERDLIDVESLHVRNMPAVKIAEKICEGRDYTISVATIRTDIKKINERWQSRYLADIHEHKRRAIAKLEEIEREAWAEWERSKLIPEDEDGAFVGMFRIGQAEFLRTILACVAQQVKIEGLEAPRQTEVTGPNGGPIELKRAEDMSDDELATIAAEWRVVEPEGEPASVELLEPPDISIDTKPETNEPTNGRTRKPPSNDADT